MMKYVVVGSKSRLVIITTNVGLRVVHRESFTSEGSVEGISQTTEGRTS